MTYYTAFGFNKFSIKEIHCTHKYLGKLSLDDEEKVIKIIENYLNKKKLKSFIEDFSQVEYFGSLKNIRVITPIYPKFDYYLLDLREQLSIFKKDDFPTYQPHISTNTFNRINNYFDYFCIVKDNQIIKKWLLS